MLGEVGVEAAAIVGCAIIGVYAIFAIFFMLVGLINKNGFRKNVNGVKYGPKAPRPARPVVNCDSDDWDYFAAGMGGMLFMTMSEQARRNEEYQQQMFNEQFQRDMDQFQQDMNQFQQDQFSAQNHFDQDQFNQSMNNDLSNMFNDSNNFGGGFGGDGFGGFGGMGF